MNDFGTTDLRALDDTDPITRAELRRLAVHSGGPCVSIFMPTHRFRPDIQQDPLRLRGLLDQAHRRLCDLGLRSPHAWELLAPHRELVGRLDFWLHQSAGLALFAAPGFHRRFRVPIDLADEVTVGTRFRVRPLLALPAGDEQFSVLCLSPHRIRLFAATPSTFAELPLSGVPVNEAETIAFDDVERQSHTRSPLGRGMRLHGHGGDASPHDDELVRFLAAVDRGIGNVLGPDPGPLVVAGTAEDVDAFSRVTRRPDLIVGRVVGDPEHRVLRELHHEALTAARPALDAERQAAVERVHETADQHVVVDLAEITRAAEDGRVASLLVATGTPSGAWAGDAVDVAIAETLSHGGTAVAVDEIDLRRGAGAVARNVEPSFAAALLRD